MAAPKQEIGVTSEASDGQSAMEMVILYCVSLERGKQNVSTGLPLLGVTGTSVPFRQQPHVGFCNGKEMRIDGR